VAAFTSKDGWYTFEINWEQDRIQFAVDGQVYFEYLRGDSVDVWPFDEHFHLIMNLAVGGAWGGAQGIDTASFEGKGQTMEVDWVRVYGEQATYCDNNSCTQQVWDTMASDNDGTYSCGSRILWLQSDGDSSESQACSQVARDFPGLCSCSPSSPNTAPTNP